MKIPPSTPAVTGGNPTQAGESGRAKGTSDKAGVKPGSRDAVHLSPLSTQLHALAASLSGPEFDRAKVDQIKQAMRDGTLVIKPDAVADRMIEDVKNRIGKGGK